MSCFELMSGDHMELAWQFRVSSFSCENPDYYREYLAFSSTSDHNIGMGVTHVLVERNENNEAIAILGYVTLRMTSFTSQSEDGKKACHPSLEIAELAVNEKYERTGIGSDLVNYAIYTADWIRKKYVALKYICLCADPMAVGFYQKNRFQKLEDYYEMPYDGANNNCIPMYLMLPDLS